MPRYDNIEFESGQVCLGTAPAEWGWSIVLALALVSGAYFGGGALYRRQVHRVRGWKMLPHATLWAEVGALVRDGLQYTRTGRRGGYQSLSRRGGGGGDGSHRGDDKAARRSAKQAHKKKIERQASSQSKRSRGRDGSSSSRSNKSGLEAAVAVAPAVAPPPSLSAAGVRHNTHSRPLIIMLCALCVLP
jgi:hypothetical protein